MAKTSAKPESHPIAVFALKEKRAEIAGTIAELQRQIAQHRADLMHIHYTLRLIDPCSRSLRRVPSGSAFRQSAISRKGNCRAASMPPCGETRPDEAMAEEQLADPRIRSFACRDSYPGPVQMAIDGKLIRLRDGYNVRWELAEADPL